MPAPLTITVSENAAKHVRDFTQRDENEPISLRVGVKGGGCSGLTYDLSIDSETRENDKVIEQHGVTIQLTEGPQDPRGDLKPAE